jgi:hypothetical protein
LSLAEALLFRPTVKIVVELDFNFNERESCLPSHPMSRCKIFLCDDVEKL